MANKPQILILGGGYAGVTAAIRLRRLVTSGKAQITLVNNHNYHYLTTLLHHPTIWNTALEEVSVYLPRLLSPQIGVLRGIVQTIDPQAHQVEVKTRGETKALTYDALIIALGWEPQFYEIEGLQEHALVLHDLSSAHLIHSRIELAMVAYDENPDQHWCTHILIGGGGFTGVELAGEMVDWRPRLAKTFDLDPKEIHITVVEGAETILPGFDPLLIKQATNTLTRKGVELITGALISRVESHCVVLGNDQRLEAGVIIWAGGVRGHHLVEQSGFAVNRQGRAYVNELLQARDHPDVYIIGDCSLFVDDQGRPLPSTAQIAFQQGYWAARNLSRQLADRAPEPFRPKRLGTFLSLGHKDALGVLNLGGFGLHFSGWAARTLKNLIGYRYLWGLGGPRLMMRKMLKR
ncbi:MAG: NAD(P)/FAD-dependent oxidoreductase [Candidatus Bipolaricaulia bacterium]